MKSETVERPGHARGAYDVVIVGAGFSGIGMAIALRKNGVSDFLILEKKEDFGGVWRDNTYPGAACDVPSHLYSFSFEPNADWSRVFSPQPEIHNYLRRCANKYDLASRTRFRAEVAKTVFDEALGLWELTLTAGATLCTRALVVATGQLSRPAIPNLEGADRFSGPSFHSAQWDHGVDFEGKRVAVIGTGASAVQFIPELAKKVGHLTVFQRTPVYVLPRPDRAYAAEEAREFASRPWRRLLHRFRMFWEYDLRALGFGRNATKIMAPAVSSAQQLLAKQVKDPAVRRALTPAYLIGCRRILLSNDYLPTFNRDNVDLVTEPIAQLEGDGVRTVDGCLISADVIIYGTGFTSTDFLAPMEVIGREGRRLSSAWSEGARAYFGVSVPGFPNFFVLYGPNTNLGHNSIILMIEAQIVHITKLLRLVLKASVAVEVRERPYRVFAKRMSRKLEKTVWSTCRSYYLDAQGRNTTNWPGFAWTYRWLIRFAGRRAYDVRQTGRSAGPF